MNTLVVGGTGLIGGHAALHLRALGHNVTISGRTKPQAPSPLADLPFLQGNYLKDDITKEQLSAFETVVFTAGADARHVPANEKDIDAYVMRANGEGVPAFAARARDAGVVQFIHVGSYYWHALPALAEASAYVRSRQVESEGVVALARPGFVATSLCPPMLVGDISATIASPIAAELVLYFQGKFGPAETAPPGGMAFLTLRSLSQAIAGAVANRTAGVAGKVLFVSDENLTFVQFFDYFRRAMGVADGALRLDDDHALFPKMARMGGDANVFIETTPETHALLGAYARNDVYNAVKEIVAKRV
ncbi:NAD(P)-binding domain protein [Cordyceps fumosorosea ARSEF 2679]|uniref:NAD(P)-binding domain protein n=1 Tax=Cordyceps fumosorosea (strain ARSEF 2679) TaxID=1081104 RepID=A0A167Q2W6_CORFA|nr:NAD(P)-binding domain protein [Cordyceps fumosorosea ARSEF 2679]OAA57232.1 NAD(P)-binding domain protein [Cordyceps fumosorosea ARSEF 2679]